MENKNKMSSEEVYNKVFNNPLEFTPSKKKVTNIEASALLDAGYRWCSKCKRVLTLDNFKSNYRCVDCVRQYRLDNLEKRKQKDREYYLNNKELKKQQAAEYRKNNQDKIIENRKKYYEENKDEILKKNAEYREENIDKVRLQQKEYHQKHRTKRNEYRKNYSKNGYQQIDSKKRKERYNTDEIYHIQQTCRALVRRAYLSIGTSKEITTREFLGYSALDLRNHIEAQFKEGMSWDNHGEWHIDHIKPISLATTLEEGIELSQLENLQPLWAEENIKKSNNI